MIDWESRLIKAKQMLDMGIMKQDEFNSLKERAFADLGLCSTTDDAFFNPLGGLRTKPDHITSPSTPTPKPQTSTIGQYVLREKIGEGGMGSVYVGHHKNRTFAQAQGDVAIKVISHTLFSQAHFKERFEQEAALGRILEHDNIARVIDLYEDDEQIAFVMEYIDGKELSQHIPTRGLDPKEALHYLKPLAKAIDYLHSKGVIHRDLKPSNIKVTVDKRPVILDFGIAKKLEDNTPLTQTGSSMGTEAYMAPEQMDAKHVGPKADQYSLSMIAYQMIAGRLPWKETDSSARITVAKMTGSLKPLSHFSDISPALSKSVMKGLSTDPKDRFPSCEALFNAIQQSIDAVEPTAVPIPAPIAPSKKQNKKNYRSLTFVLLGLLAFAGIQYSSINGLEAKMNSDLEDLITDAEKYGLDIPTGNPSEDKIHGLRLDIEEQVHFHSEIRPHVAQAKKLGITVPQAPLSRYDVEDFKDEINIARSNNSRKSFGNTRVSRDETQTLYNQKLIYSGSFEMGCGDEQEDDCRSDETPNHRVRISQNFYIMQSEVTQKLYQKVTGQNPSQYKDCGKECPVENVSWLDAVEFANELSQIEGLGSCYRINGKKVHIKPQCTGWRLPTEAEWEYAAKANDRYKYSGSNRIDDVAWYAENNNAGPNRVCTRKENGFGLCDMSGNVWEWTQDWYGEYTSKRSTDPQGPKDGNVRVLRGGDWNQFSLRLRTSHRGYGSPKMKENIGIRLVRIARR
ncbi:MAG: bifunctional serine/threonine-protein kinase/formylglycine-generating enzyme family protein [Myxococcota bacterium]|nr:bifunctional serine/threonine-protein kinase/formylglycine-generating enzyme family protein [Myxococcota bacterium]